MNKQKFLSFIFAGFLMIFSFSALEVKAQEEMPPPDEAPNKREERLRRPNLLRELNLSKEQRQQIRRIHQQKKPQLGQAQQHFREANQNLDREIYADNVNEAEIRARLKEAQLAQSELVQIRTLTELEVRRILTTEQLGKFREIRENFMRQNGERFQRRENRFNNRLNNRRNRRLNNRQTAPIRSN